MKVYNIKYLVQIMGCNSSVPTDKVKEEEPKDDKVKEEKPKDAVPKEVEYITSKSSYGYLTKQGQKNKLSWKRRFFAVENGIMTYYERETFTNSHIGVNELGKINLNGYTISSNGDIIKLTKLNERELGYIIV